MWALLGSRSCVRIQGPADMSFLPSIPRVQAFRLPMLLQVQRGKHGGWGHAAARCKITREDPGGFKHAVRSSRIGGSWEKTLPRSEVSGRP